MTRRGIILLLSTMLALVGASSAHAGPGPVPCRNSCWKPSIGTSFAWQLQGTIRTGTTADVFDVDAVDTPRRTLDELHRRGRRVVCYVSAGSWERWRSDSSRYPDSLLGEDLDGWPGERWVDIRDARLRPIIARRIAACARRGFDGIEFDNVAGYTNQTGFDLRYMDQIRFNRWLANTAHRHGLAVGLKNDPAQVRALVRWFDFAVVEQCFQYDECGRYVPFIRARKPVYVAEYDLPLARFCTRARKLRFSAARYRLDLAGPRWACAWPR